MRTPRSVLLAIVYLDFLPVLHLMPPNPSSHQSFPHIPRLYVSFLYVVFAFSARLPVRSLCEIHLRLFALFLTASPR